jgi:5S rRNA maturation endonuclease (ribonuclease M5)
MYDLPEIFAAIDIRFWTSGKNTAPGWVNIQCIYCGDHSNHLGVSLESGSYHCWKCDAVGSLPNLIYDLTDMNRVGVGRLVREHRSEGVGIRRKEHKQATQIKIPACFDQLPELHREYLEARGFQPKEIVEKYQVKATHHVGRWGYRLIVPVIFNGEMVNFTAMDVSGQSTKYIHCPNEQAIMDMKSVLYNFDTVRDRVIVCEGVTDVWRMGDGAVATFGTQFTERQINLLVERVKQVWVLYDSDATKKGERLAYQLSGVVDRVENISLSKGDPADLSPAMVRKIRRWVYG